MIRTLNKITQYIEDHLHEPISEQMLQNAAGVSYFHLKTVFFHLTGTTLNEYIRYRRLSQAARQLETGRSVTDVAFEWGYDSVDGFSRAFHGWSGLRPSEVYKTGQCAVYPKMTFSISISGGNTMQYRIVEKDRFYLAGKAARVPLQFNGVNQHIVQLAQSITEEQRQAMHELMNTEPREILNASWDSDSKFLKEEGELTHLIGVATATDPKESGLDFIEVPNLTWAVFPYDGPFPQALQQTTAAIYSQWLASSEYELVAAPQFSWTKFDSQNNGFAAGEVWVAVKRL